MCCGRWDEGTGCAGKPQDGRGSLEARDFLIEALPRTRHRYERAVSRRWKEERILL